MADSKGAMASGTRGQALSAIRLSIYMYIHIYLCVCSADTFGAWVGNTPKHVEMAFCVRLRHALNPICGNPGIWPSSGSMRCQPD